MDTDKIEGAVKHLLLGIGEDTEREGLQGTPKRVAKYYREFLNPPQFKFTDFDSDGYDEMIIQKNIEFYSLCEHHLLPFFGLAHVAYVPDKRIVGLSKLARTVELFARRPQNQERITHQVAEFLQENLQPQGVAVSITARHLCMEMRGVRNKAQTTTTTLIGSFKESSEARQEFLDSINTP